MSEQQTCGKGVAARAALPAKLAGITAAMADILGFHQRSIDGSDANGVAELQTYVRLEEQYGTAATLLRSIAAEMADARDLPMARHDVSVLASAENRAIFERFIGLERELAELLQKSIDEDRAILAGMRGK